jgi:hypothetical protein
VVCRDGLSRIEPPATAMWKAVTHAPAVDLIHEELACRETAVVKEEYAIQRDGYDLWNAPRTDRVVYRVKP